MIARSAGPLLVLDTATRRAVLGVAERDGRLVAADGWPSDHRHGEELLPRLEALLARTGFRPTDLGAIVVGTGPGSFTGLRIGLATAKVLAYSLDVPLVAVATSRALGRALADGGERGNVAVALPAGAHDRYVTRMRLGEDGAETLDAAEIVARLDAADDETLVAVDLAPPEVSAEAAALGRSAVDGLAPALAREGAAALAAGDVTDVATLVPGYVALPRGIALAAENMQWSPDLR